MNKTPNIVIVLDNIRSLHNVGAIFRTADAVGVEKIVCCGITSTPDHPRLAKTALGAEQSVSWEYRGATADAISSLKQAGYTIVVAEYNEHSQAYTELDFSAMDTIALVLGAETTGVSQEAQDQADYIVHLPMRGQKESLNVAVAGSVLLYAISTN